MGCVVLVAGGWVSNSEADPFCYEDEVAVSTPLSGKPKLTTAGRDQSKLIDGLDEQVVLVRAVAADSASEVTVHGALCFVDADLPLLSKLSFKGSPLLYPKPMAKRLNPAGPVTAGGVRISPPSSRRGKLGGVTGYVGYV